MSLALEEIVYGPAVLVSACLPVVASVPVEVAPVVKPRTELAPPARIVTEPAAPAVAEVIFNAPCALKLAVPALPRTPLMSLRILVWVLPAPVVRVTL